MLYYFSNLFVYLQKEKIIKLKKNSNINNILLCNKLYITQYINNKNLFFNFVIFTHHLNVFIYSYNCIRDEGAIMIGNALC